MTPPGREAEGPVAELVARLREAGCEAGPEQVAEALWLARRMTVPERPEPPPPPPAQESGAGLPGDRPQAPPVRSQEPADERPEPGPTQPLPPVSLYAPARHRGALGAASPVRAPAVGTLGGLLDMQRALRPLQRYRSPQHGRRGPLDEERTADLSARSAAVRPVFQQQRSGGTEIQLFMDTSASASVWQLTFDSLRQTCERLGAFHDVQALYLHQATDGTPLVGTEPSRDAGPLRPADQYRDTTGRRITLVVSDCVGALWQDGAAQRMLHRWSGESPLAVVQPLPPRLWRRTALPAQPGLLVRGRGTGGRIGFEPDDVAAGRPDGGLPVPVLLPTPVAMGSWARLLGGQGAGRARGAAAWVTPRHRAMPAPAAVPQHGRDPREVLRHFRATASPGALSLAVHLTAVPLILPVIQLVQEAMLPGTGPTELAEVLLGGILQRLPDGDDGTGPRYAFVPGVHELLMQSLDRGTAELVLKYVSEYVERRFGTGTRNFPALAVARLSGHAPPRTPGGGAATPDIDGEIAVDELFAQVPARVLRWYAPETGAPGRRAEAERLLRDWRAQGDPGLLHQAHALAEAAVADAGGAVDGASAQEAAGRAGNAGLAGARLVLGRVLHALTRTGDVRGTPHRVVELLHAAARQLVGADPQTRFELVAVRHRLWHAEHDTRHLLAAERVLRDMSPAPDDAAAESSRTEVRRRLWLGRTLLALARAAVDPHVADFRSTAAGRRPSRHAEQAVVELEAVCDLLMPAGGAADDATGGTGDARQDGDPAADPCSVLLDLCAALRYAGAGTDTRLAAVARADEVAGEDRALRMRAARARARVHRDAEEWEQADLAYTAAEKCTHRESRDRSELLAEWGTMLTVGPWHPDRAEGVLREALTSGPVNGPLAARLPMLLGRALTRRYLRERFLPDLYEGAELLEQATRRSEDHRLLSDAWLLLAEAEQEFPAKHAHSERALRALHRSLEEARRVQQESPGTAAVARALHATGDFRERQGDRAGALAAYRSAADEWQRLVARLADVPWPEVARTRDLIRELGTG